MYIGNDIIIVSIVTQVNPAKNLSFDLTHT